MNKIKYMRVLILIFISISCEDYLDVVPDNVATIDNAFTDEVQARKYLFTCYSYLPNASSLSGTPGWLSGDEFWFNTHQRSVFKNAFEIAENTQNADNPRLNYYERLYRGIRVCNTFISRIDDVRGMDDSDKKRWKSEAVFLKAYYHYYLIKMYGPIPLMDVNIPISASPDEVNSIRQPFDECIDYVVDLLDVAAEGLPSVILSELDELGRITRTIALSIKSEVLLTAASPLFNGNTNYSNFNNIDGTPFFTAYDTEKWKRAADATLEAIEEAEQAGKSLYTFSDLIVGGISPTTELKMTLRGRVTERWNSEVIWSNTISDDLQSISQPNLPGRRSGATQQSLSPTLRVVNQYYTNNGIPVEEDKNWVDKKLLSLRLSTATDKLNIKEGEEIPEMHFDREHRFYADLGFDRGVWFGQGRLDENNTHIVKSRLGENSGKSSIQRFSITGYFPKKLVDYKSTFNSTGDYRTRRYPFPIMRLSELYLSYAEAMNEYSGPSADIYRYIDLVRDRAGLEGVVKSWSDNSLIPDKPLGKDGLRDIIHRERLIELSFENHRYWDLRRWKLAKNYMNSPIRGWSVEFKEKEDYYNIINLFDQKFEDRDYLWPLRTYILLENTNLVQNPGW